MMDKLYDLGIIGAGMVGASAAWLAKKRHPDWEIALIDRSLAGHGTSLYSASLDIPYGHTSLRKVLSLRSHALFQEFRNELPQLPLSQLKIYGFVDSNRTQEVLQHFTDTETHVASSEELERFRKQHPELIIPENMVLLTGTSGGRAYRNSVAIELAQAFAGQPGAAMMEGTEITKINKTDQGYALMTKPGNSIHCQRIIQATGPWIASGLGHELIRGTKTRIKKIVALHIREQPNDNDPVFHFFDNDAFLMPQPEKGQWLFSFRCEEWDVEPEISQLSISEADLNTAKSVLARYRPDWIDSISGGRVFCDGYRPDADPLVTHAPGRPDYVIAGVCGGSGFRLGPGVADLSLSILGTESTLNHDFQDEKSMA